jgi:hypothetical protein
MRPAESVLSQACSGGAPSCAPNDVFCTARVRLVGSQPERRVVRPDRSVAGDYGADGNGFARQCREDLGWWRGY